MTITEIANQYGIPLETAAQMHRDGVLLTQFLTTEEVATRYRLKPKTIHKLVRDGDLPVRRLKGSRLLRFDPLDIDAFTQNAEEATPSNVVKMKR
ncbi:MAG: helix-turn-helix domain-containing protein [Blastocatellia bacterium]